jgi:uncharacterized phage-associated protein
VRVLPQRGDIDTMQTLLNFFRHGFRAVLLRIGGDSDYAKRLKKPASRGREVEVMPAHSAPAIANEFLRRRADSTWPPQMLIQKLAYIAHGWSLAITGQPLIAEPAEAWDNGPVYRSIWERIKEHWYNGEHCTLVDPVTKLADTATLSDVERQIIEHVWKKYRAKSAGELSRMTHELGTPWHKAYFGRGRNAPLDNAEIKQHYIDLALAGRAAA